MLDAMARHKPVEIPPDLRTRLETARLDLLALFRALDRMYLTPDQIPNGSYDNCLNWTPIMWKHSGDWTSHPES
jgi:hypothetical protein